MRLKTLFLFLVSVLSFFTHAQTGKSQTLSLVGSDTLAGIMIRWAQVFEDIYPQANIQIQASGSSSTPTALLQGTSQMGAMSRAMTENEQQAFKKKYGYLPTQLSLAFDGVGILVHQNNPIEGLNVKQLDAIFSETLLCGAHESIESWQQLGITTPWKTFPIQGFGRNSVSGTYRYVKQQILCGGDFKTNINERLGAASVVEGVAEAINGIGYASIGDHHSNTRFLPIAAEGSAYVFPSIENMNNGSYPLKRPLYLYINQHPQQALPPIEASWLQFIYSPQGQAMIKSEGYVPLSNEDAQQQLNKVIFVK